MDRPIHCINKKALEFVVKEDDEWKSKDGNKKVDKVINSITQERIKKMQEWKKTNPNYMNDEKLYQTYNEIISNIMDAAEEESNWRKNVKKKLSSNIDIKEAISDIDK